MIYMDTNEGIIKLKHIPSLNPNNAVRIQDIERFDTNQGTLQDAVEKFEETYIKQVYQSNHYNKTKTAKELNISIRNLYYKMDKYRF